MKLPNGYGSIYKNGGNRRNPYRVSVTIGWDNDKQIRKILGYVKSPKEGLKLLAEYHGNPYDLNYKNLTFSDIWKAVLIELENLVIHNKMSESNLKSLSLAFKNHCKPLHNDKILELKYKKMQNIIDSVDLGYSAKGHIKTVCVKTFEYAINEYELPIQNEARKLKVGEKIKSDKHIPFTDEEKEFLWTKQSNDLIKILLINLYTGTRPNEIFITEKDQIFEDYFITGSKTEAGKNRIVPIHPKIKHLIKYFCDKDDNLPFTTIFEKFNYSKFSREFTKLMNTINFNHTPYDARHTFISNMKKAGANEFILKRIVGHSITDITENVYTHRGINELINEVKKID